MSFIDDIRKAFGRREVPPAKDVFRKPEMISLGRVKLNGYAGRELMVVVKSDIECREAGERRERA